MAAKKITWETRKVKLGDLTEWEENPRHSTPEQAERIKQSFEKFDYSQLIEIEPDMTLIDGHQRKPVMELLKKFGSEAEIEVRVSSRKFTKDERKEYIALKHQGAMGEWDAKKMAILAPLEHLVRRVFRSTAPEGIDAVSEPMPGVAHHTIYRFGTKAEVLVIDPIQNEIVVSRYIGARKLVKDWAKELFLHGAVNGDGWNSAPEYNWPNSVAASMGHIYQITQKDGRPICNVTHTGDIQITDQIRWGDLWNCVSFDRFLVMDGKVNPALYWRPYEKNARTVAGKTADGKLVLMVCAGQDMPDPWVGWSFIEAAEVLIEFDCTWAGNLDGGGSTTAELLGETLLPQIDDGVAKNRPVVNIIGWRAKGDVPIDPEPDPPVPLPPDGGTMSKWKVLQTVRQRSLPNFYNPGQGDAVAGYEFTSVASVPDTKPVNAPPPTIIWEQDSVTLLWIPRRHHTDEIFYLELVDETPPPPAVDPVVLVTLTFESGETQDFVPADG